MGHVLSVLADGIVDTLAITLGAFALGAVLGVPLATARMAAPWPLRWLVTVLVDLLRAVPPIVWIFLVFFGLPQAGIEFQPVPAAIVALGIVAGAYLSEIYRGAVRAIPRGQWEAGHAIGLRDVTLVRLVIAPQAARIALPPASTYLLGLLKDSALASAIGVGEITFHAFAEAQQSLEGLRVFSIAALVYLALSLPLAFAGRWVDARLRRRLGVA